MRKPSQKTLFLCTTACFALLSSTSFAQQALPYSPTGSTAATDSTGSQPAGAIPLGPINAYPSIGLSLKHDDNLFSTPNNTKGDWSKVLTPSVRFEAKQAANTYSLTLGSTIGRYNNSTADNYTNYNANGLADLDMTARLRARLKADYTDAQDPRGSTNNPLSSEPDRYRENYLGGVVSYGAQGAKGRIDFELGHLTHHYYNNRATTYASDHDNTDVGATFYWRVAPKTSLLVQGKHTSINYLWTDSTQDSKENRLLAGVTWEATAKTTGIFKLGMARKSFDDPNVRGGTQASWEGAIRWSPRTYSTVDLNLAKTPAETTGGLGNYIDRTNTGAVWTHQWNSRVTTAATVSYLTDQYKGFDRKDNTQNYGLKATYNMRRWLNLGADYMHTLRDSSDANFDFKRNTIMLFVNASL